MFGLFLSGLPCFAASSSHTSSSQNATHAHTPDELDWKTFVPDSFKKLTVPIQPESNEGEGILLLTPSHNENFKRHDIPVSIGGTSYTWNVEDSVVIGYDRQIKDHLVKIWNALSDAPQEADAKEISDLDRVKNIVNTLNSLGNLFDTRTLLTDDKKRKCLTNTLTTVLSAITFETYIKSQNLCLIRMKLVDTVLRNLILELEDYREDLKATPSSTYIPEVDIELTRLELKDVWQYFELNPPNHALSLSEEETDEGNTDEDSEGLSDSPSSPTSSRNSRNSTKRPPSSDESPTKEKRPEKKQRTQK